MLQKLNQAHETDSVYVPPKNSYETLFGIQHFAGIVHYDSKGIIFLAVNLWFIFCVTPIVYWFVYFRFSWEKPWLSQFRFDTTGAEIYQ